MTLGSNDRRVRIRFDEFQDEFDDFRVQVEDAEHCAEVVKVMKGVEAGRGFDLFDMRHSGNFVCYLPFQEISHRNNIFHRTLPSHTSSRFSFSHDYVVATVKKGHDLLRCDPIPQGK